MGPHPKTATVERRERSRSPRDRVVARRRRDRKNECACRRSIHPSSGGRNCCCRDGRWCQSPVGSPADAKAKAHAKRRTTRAQQRAAGTNNTALFDIVNWEMTANGSLRAPRLRALPSRVRASTARPGTQGRHDGPQPATTSAMREFVALGPGSRSARARALAALGRDTRAPPRHQRPMAAPESSAVTPGRPRTLAGSCPPAACGR